MIIKFISIITNSDAPFLAILSTGMPVMPEVANKHTPNGGVNVPIEILMLEIIPKCTGSIP